MKTFNKCSRPAHFCSVLMHVSISEITAVFACTHKRWFCHQCELGGDSGTLRFRVGWFRRKEPVKFRHHQTPYHSQVLIVANIKSKLVIYFTIRKTQLHITRCTCSKLKRGIQIFRSTAKLQVHFTKHSWKCAGNS